MLSPAGVVDQDVDPAERLVRLEEKALDCVGVEQVGLDRRRLAAGFVIGGRRPRPPRGARVVDDDRGPVGGQPAGDSRPDAPGTARHQCDFPLQSTHLSSRSGSILPQAERASRPRIACQLLLPGPGGLGYDDPVPAAVPSRGPAMLEGPLVFVNVDTQRDFLDPDGALFIAGSGAIRPNLARLTRFARDRGIPILATACAHGRTTPSSPTSRPTACSGPRARPGSRRPTGPADPSSSRAADPRADPAPPDDPQTGVRRLLQPRRRPGGRAYGRDRPDVVVYGVATDYCVRCAVTGCWSGASGWRSWSTRSGRSTPRPRPELLTDFARAGRCLTVTDVATRRASGETGARVPPRGWIGEPRGSARPVRPPGVPGRSTPGCRPSAPCASAPGRGGSPPRCSRRRSRRDDQVEVAHVGVVGGEQDADVRRRSR